MWGTDMYLIAAALYAIASAVFFVAAGCHGGRGMNGFNVAGLCMMVLSLAFMIMAGVNSSGYF